MDVHAENIDQGVKIALAGEVDLHNSPMVREKLLEAAGRKAPLVVVDLAGVLAQFRLQRRGGVQREHDHLQHEPAAAL